MKTFTFYFLDGTTKTLEGETVEQAFSTCYGHGVLAVVDFYDEGPVSDQWVYFKDERCWHSQQYIDKLAQPIAT